jgi:hypothetical protein
MRPANGTLTTIGGLTHVDAMFKPSKDIWQQLLAMNLLDTHRIGNDKEVLLEAFYAESAASNAARIAANQPAESHVEYIKRLNSRSTEMFKELEAKLKATETQLKGLKDAPPQQIIKKSGLNMGKPERFSGEKADFDRWLQSMEDRIELDKPDATECRKIMYIRNYIHAPVQEWIDNQYKLYGHTRDWTMANVKIHLKTMYREVDKVPKAQAFVEGYKTIPGGRIAAAHQDLNTPFVILGLHDRQKINTIWGKIEQQSACGGQRCPNASDTRTSTPLHMRDRTTTGYRR